MSYKTCKWCGRKFDERDAVYSGLGSAIFGNDFGGCVYCSEKCKKEAQANKGSSRSNNSYEIEREHSAGLFGIIWKLVKWVIIITVVWFVYDSYIK